MAFIKVEHLKYKYPHSETLALDNLSFEVEKGSFIGIIGENGAGKSTLCQAFMGLVPSFYKGAYGGSVLIDGLRADVTAPSDMCGKVGLVFQNPFNQLSGAKDKVFSEIAFGLQNMGIPRDEILRRVEDIMERLQIGHLKDQNPFDLSGGQMQRVAIASILAMQPDVIVLDEPTSQLDPGGSEEVFAVVEALMETGITIIMAEQKMEKLADYCDKILLIHQGRQVDFDVPEAVFSREDLEEIGIQPPVYTRLGRALDVKTSSGQFPVKLEDILQCKDQLDGVMKAPGVIGGKAECAENKSSPKTIFEIKELQFSYQAGTPILYNLNLRLDGRITAVIGQNGAGKTTLMKLLKGLLKLDEGQILYDGEDISGKTAAMLSRHIGYVFQNPDDQIFKYNVLDEVMFGPLNIGMKMDKAEEQARKALEMTGLGDKTSVNPYDLELAERKMVAMASVIAMDTDVIIFDEPTIAQDYRGRERIKGIIRHLADQEKFVLAILHDMDFVAECFERVIVMSGGEILADGDCHTVFSDEEALKKASLELPHTGRLWKALGREGLVLTVDQLQ